MTRSFAIEIERRKAEQQLRISRDQLEAVLGSVPESITVQDAAGRLVYANEAAAQLSSFASPEEMLASSPSEILGRFELLDESGAPLGVERLPGRRVFGVARVMTNRPREGSASFHTADARY